MTVIPMPDDAEAKGRRIWDKALRDERAKSESESDTE